MIMKLSFWNWVHLLSPYIIAAISLHYGLDNTYWNCLFGSHLFIFLFAIIPFASREEKTGRSFKTKYGKIDEYQTVESNYQPSTITGYIMLLHLIGIILFFIL